jgi:hypothetical protein
MMIKRAALLGAFLLLFFVVISLFSGYSRNSTGLSGSVTVTSVPAMGIGGDRYYAPNVAYLQDADVSVKGNAMRLSDGSYSGYPEMMPPLPSREQVASTPTIPSERKIIKNGSLSLVVKNVESALLTVSTITNSVGGFVESSSVNEYETYRAYPEAAAPSAKHGYATIRVPSENFDGAMASLKGLAVRVENEQSNSSDVSAQYVDLEAQLKNYRAEEEQYQEIMERAEKIEDVLQVAVRLSDVRGRIERTQGQLNLLSRQVSMSTINVSLTPEANPIQATEDWRPMSVLKESLKNTLAEAIDLTYGLIRFTAALPILILYVAFYALILLGIFRATKWGYVRITGKPFPRRGDAL